MSHAAHRPTTIYWLAIDGKPFYAGKTVYTPTGRMHEHIKASKMYPDRPVSVRIREAQAAGRELSVHVVEVVPARDDWETREKHWIAKLRAISPNCANSTDGGEGIPGLKHAVSTRAKQRLAGKKRDYRDSAELSAMMRQIKEEDDLRERARSRLKCQCCAPDPIILPKSPVSIRLRSSKGWLSRRHMQALLAARGLS